METNNAQEQSQTWRRKTILFIISQAITLFGSSIVQMAIIWQVALETSSGLWVTLLTLSSTLPQTIISFFAADSIRSEIIWLWHSVASCECGHSANRTRRAVAPL